MNDFRRGRGNAGRCSFRPLRTGWEGWMFRHLPRPIIDLSPALNNHQASTGIELWALQCLRREASWMVLASQLPHLLNRDKELAQDHTRLWGQSRESHLAYFRIQVRGRAQPRTVLWRRPYIGFMLGLFSIIDVCRQKALELPHAAPHVRSGGRSYFSLPFWTHLANSKSEILCKTCKFICSLFRPYKCTCHKKYFKIWHDKNVYNPSVLFTSYSLTSCVFQEGVSHVGLGHLEWVAKGPPCTWLALARE